MSEKRIIVVHESVRASWLKDAGTWALFVGLTLPGHLLGSDLLEITGWIVAVIMLFKSVGKVFGKSGHYTIDEARALLDEIERGGGRR